MTAATETPITRIEDYLARLRAELEGADPAMIQDALSDAEEHLRAECAARPGDSEDVVLRDITQTYGSPADVAAAYRDTDRTVQAAISPQRRTASTGASQAGALRKFFAVYGDSRSWTTLLYMLLSLMTGVLYFCVVVVGVSLSLGLSILIIGIPVLLAFLALTRVLALAEGRLVEAMTGERMPRRPRPATDGSWLARIWAMLGNLRTWTTLGYQLLMLPLGVLYFTLAITFSMLGIGLIGGGAWDLLRVLGVDLPDVVHWGDFVVADGSLGSLLFTSAGMFLGVFVLTGLMHFARLVGRCHGKFAKVMLVGG